MAKKIAFFFLFLAGSLFFAQEVSQERMVRFSLWAPVDIFPGVEIQDDSEERFSLPVKKIKEISPFILSGMVNGWNFDYVPYDKARRVPEFFEFTPIRELLDSEIKTIRYKLPWIEESRLNCWVEYRRSDSQVSYYRSWLGVNYPRIKGVGYAPLSEGFEGIKKACGEALKQAVREYERKRIKTKPKEIIGKALLCQPPLIGIDAGRYVVTLDFFMESDRIIEYKTF